MSRPNPLEDITTLIGNTHELADLTRDTIRELIGAAPPAPATGLTAMQAKGDNEGRLYDIAAMALVAARTVQDAIQELHRLRETLLNDQITRADRRG